MDVVEVERGGCEGHGSRKFVAGRPTLAGTSAMVAVEEASFTVSIGGLDAGSALELGQELIALAGKQGKRGSKQEQASAVDKGGFHIFRFCGESSKLIQT